MIQEIDEMLFENSFASRSDFFRHLVRMWFLDLGQVDSKDAPVEESKEEFADVDLEFGIPWEVIKELEEKAKLIN
jgi:Arc/MetJ-type ribon-helix-helix transcriptional regulator